MLSPTRRMMGTTRVLFPAFKEETVEERESPETDRVRAEIEREEGELEVQGYRDGIY